MQLQQYTPTALVAFIAMCALVAAEEGARHPSLTQLLQEQAMKREALDPHDEKGNPCPDVEKPFPCKKSKTCVPMVYVCDKNYDCEDGYDEDPELCTAAHRPPVEDITLFLDKNSDWIMPNLFPGQSIGSVAHSLAVSPNVAVFQRRQGIEKADTRNLKMALSYVADSNRDGMHQLGMPTGKWTQVVYLFAKLINSGFKAEVSHRSELPHDY